MAAMLVKMNGEMYVNLLARISFLLGNALEQTHPIWAVVKLYAEV
jgi:hypothetical protein